MRTQKEMKTLKTLAVVMALVLLSVTVFIVRAYAQNTYAGGVSGTVTNNCLPKSNGNSSFTTSSLCDDGTTFSITEPLSTTKQIKTTLNPADTTNTSASLLVNPAAAATNEPLLGVLLNGSNRLLVDAEGDTSVAGTFTATGASTLTGAATLSSTLGVTGAVTASSTLDVAGLTTTTGGLIAGATRNTGTGGTLTTATSGQTHIAAAATDAASTFILPAASTKARFCFSVDDVTGSNRELKIETPTGSDLIVGTTTPAGGTGIATTAGASHGIKNTHATAVRGNATCVSADGTNTWYMTSLSGVWAAY